MAFTATKDLPLATTTTGSWPRPPGTAKAFGAVRSIRPCWTRSTANNFPTRLLWLYPIRSAPVSISLRAAISFSMQIWPAIVASLSPAALAWTGFRRIAAGRYPLRSLEISARHAAQRNLYIVALAYRDRQDRAQSA